MSDAKEKLTKLAGYTSPSSKLAGIIVVGRKAPLLTQPLMRFLDKYPHAKVEVVTKTEEFTATVRAYEIYSNKPKGEIWIVLGFEKENIRNMIEDKYPQYFSNLKLTNYDLTGTSTGVCAVLGSAVPRADNLDKLLEWLIDHEGKADTLSLQRACQLQSIEPATEINKDIAGNVEDRLTNFNKKEEAENILVLSVDVAKVAGVDPDRIQSLNSSEVPGLAGAGLVSLVAKGGIEEDRKEVLGVIETSPKGHFLIGVKKSLKKGGVAFTNLAVEWIVDKVLGYVTATVQKLIVDKVLLTATKVFSKAEAANPEECARQLVLLLQYAPTTIVDVKNEFVKGVTGKMINDFMEKHLEVVAGKTMKKLSVTKGEVADHLKLLKSIKVCVAGEAAGVYDDEKKEAAFEVQVTGKNLPTIRVKVTKDKENNNLKVGFLETVPFALECISPKSKKGNGKAIIAQMIEEDLIGAEIGFDSATNKVLPEEPKPLVKKPPFMNEDVWKAKYERSQVPMADMMKLSAGLTERYKNILLSAQKLVQTAAAYNKESGKAGDRVDYSEIYADAVNMAILVWKCIEALD